ncbi:MAG: ABC transporter substrate-binding protein [Treponema sp.]|jgi:multiple sugar transport system substrate-binding protein|nr:ABC transporter substrate-binding protein [Treponema sp.]
MKKQNRYALIGIFLLGLLSCGGKTSAPSGPVRIDFWYGLGGKLGETVESIIAAFNESQDEVFVTGVQQSSYQETERQLQAAVAANKVPAAAIMRVYGLNTFARRGIIAPLDSYIDAVPDFNKDDFIPSFLSYCYSDRNEIIALPAYGTTQVMYYRMDAFREAGVEPDEAFKSWQSLAEAAAKMTKRDRNGVTFYGWELMWGSSNMMDIAYGNGARHLSDDQRTALLNTPEWVDSWETVRRWIHDDQVFGLHYGGDGWEYWYKTIDDVMQGRAAGYLGSSGDQGDLDFNLVAAHVQPGYNGRPPLPYAECLALVAMSGADAAQKQAAFRWMTYFTDASVTADFSMRTGYIPVRRSCTENPEYMAYTALNPQALIPLKQAEFSRRSFIDFTGGKIDTAIEDACDLVQIENVPAAIALAEAQKIAQSALDEYWTENEE